MSSAVSMDREKSGQIQRYLEQIWSAYKAVGITENQEIVEALAIELIQIEGQDISTLPEYARPTLPAGRTQPGNIQQPLQQALQLAGNGATLFDRYLLFHNIGRVAGALYPLPRHLVDYMVRLLDIEPSHTFADFTCGSGGFLVNRNNAVRNARSVHGITLGIDKDAAQVRLAGTNLLLHDLAEECKLFLGDALLQCVPYLTPSSFDTGADLLRRKFDRIAMAAPFGESTKDDAKHWPGPGGQASEAVFTRLALSKLTEGGRAALLLPSGLTWAEDKNKLRQYLIGDHVIRAVISLPESALRPFSAVGASILLLSKETKASDRPIWHLKVMRDGYAEGADRDLQMPPDRSPAHNDLPLIEALFPGPRQGSFISPSGFSLASILLGTNQQFHGLQLQAMAGIRLETVLLFRIAPARSGELFSLYLLVKTRDHADLISFTSAGINSREGLFRRKLIFSGEQEARRFIQETHGLQQVPAGVTIYTGDRVGQSIVIASDGRVLGITLPYSAIEAGNLQPEHYMPTPERAFATANPVTTINAMRQQQSLTTHQLDNLLGQLEVKPVVGADLPPRLLPRIETGEYSLEQALGDDQRDLWQWILTTQKYIHEQQEYPRYFTAQEVIDAFSSGRDSQDRSDRLTIQATLDLFVSMGFLVFTQIVPSEQISSPQQIPSLLPLRPRPYYRLLTTLDMTDLNSQEVHL